MGFSSYSFTANLPVESASEIENQSAFVKKRDEYGGSSFSGT